MADRVEYLIRLLYPGGLGPAETVDVGPLPAVLASKWIEDYVRGGKALHGRIPYRVLYRVIPDWTECTADDVHGRLADEIEEANRG